MTFRPENPELKQDLYALFDDEINEVAVLIYESDEGLFYRNKGEWKELSNEDDTELDMDGLIVIYVNPDFINVYDDAEAGDEAIDFNELKQYQSTDPAKSGTISSQEG